MIEDWREEIGVDKMGVSIHQVIEGGTNGVTDVLHPCRRVTRERETVLQLIRRRIGEEEHGSRDRAVDGRVAEHSFQVVLLDAEWRPERE